MKKGKKITIIIVSVILSIILALVSTFFILVHIGKKQFHKDDTHISTDLVEVEDESTITFQGKKYALNKNIVSILVIGVDRNDINENIGVGKNGQADAIFVATIDTNTKKTTVIPISREIITEVNLYTSDGAYAGVKNEQLCLAYAYGATPEECSKNVMTSVRRILLGINISAYMTIELKGIGKLADMVGGVKLNSLEDIWLDGENVKAGQSLNLKGDKAVRYIQYRGNDLEANALRMNRQKQFLTSLANQVGNTVLNDFTNLSKYYNTLTPYFSTNVSLAQLTYLAQSSLSANFGDKIEYKSIEGTLNQGEKWVEFIPNTDSIMQTVIDTFYIEK